MSVTWVQVARGRKEDRGHTVTHMAEGTDPRRPRAFLKCQCGMIYSAYDSSRAFRTQEVHKNREIAKLDE